MGSISYITSNSYPLRFPGWIVTLIGVCLLTSNCALEPESAEQLDLCEDDICIVAYSGPAIDGQDNQWSVESVGDTVVIERFDWLLNWCYGFYRLVLINEPASSLPSFSSCTYTQFQPGADALTSMKTGIVEIQDWDPDDIVSGKVSGFGEPYDSFAFLFSFCAQASTVNENQVWVYINPIQCLGNPWEQAWLAEHDHDYDAYPRDDEERLRIFREFFEGQGVTIHDIEVTIWAEDVCAACTCPTGERFHCLIDQTDFEILRDWGFEEES